jgi:hypothetical protein
MIECVTKIWVMGMMADTCFTVSIAGLNRDSIALSNTCIFSNALLLMVGFWPEKSAHIT